MKITLHRCRKKKKEKNLTSISSFFKSNKNKLVNIKCDEDEDQEKQKMKHAINNLSSWDRTHLNISSNKTSQSNKSSFCFDNVLSFYRKENNIKSIKEIEYIQSFSKGNILTKSIRQMSKPNPRVKQLSINSNSSQSNICICIRKIQLNHCNSQYQEKEEEEVKTETEKIKNELMYFTEIQSVDQRIKSKKAEIDKLYLVKYELINQINSINADYYKALYKISSIIPIHSRKNSEAIVKSVLGLKYHQNSINESVQKEVAKLAKETKILLDENNKLKNEIDESISIFEEEMKCLKEINEKLQKVQIDYYTEILSQGTDTRSKGLIWIIMRLLSLKALIDESMFPSYLKHDQIEYLIKIGKLNYEVKKYQGKVKKIKERFNLIYKEPKVKIKKKIDLFQNHSCFTRNFDENRTNHTISRLKNSILGNPNTTTDNLSHKDIVNEFYKAFSNKNHSYNAYFNQLKDLRNKIASVTSEINQLLTNQLYQYRKEYKKNIILSPIETEKSRLLYAGMFGNIIL